MGSPAIRRCVICEVDITHLHGLAIVCSKACSQERQNMRRRKRGKALGRRCVVCNTGIDDLNARRITCLGEECIRKKERFYARQRRSTNKVQYTATKRAYYRKNRDKLKEQDRTRKARNRDKIKDQRRTAYLRNRAQILAKRKQDYWADPEQARERARRDRQRNLEKCRAYDRLRRKDPKRQQYEQERRQEMAAAREVLRDMKLI